MSNVYDLTFKIDKYLHKIHRLRLELKLSSLSYRCHKLQ